MIKYFTIVLTVCAILQIVNCRPSSAVEPRTRKRSITKDASLDLPAGERISKRSITKEIAMDLPSEERISKRSITRDIPMDVSTAEKISKRSISKDIPLNLPASEIINKRSITRDSSLELPATEKVYKRSPDDDSDTIYDNSSSESSNESSASDNDSGSDENAPIQERAAIESNEDLAFAESNIVFRPLFVYRKRSANKNPRPQASNSRRSRSVGDDKVHDEFDMETAENGLVFRPLFRSRGTIDEKQRVRRSTEDIHKSKTRNVDDVDIAEDLVFRPVFTQNVRYVREVQKNQNQDLVDDDMEVAENGLIFRPLFRSKQRDNAINA